MEKAADALKRSYKTIAKELKGQELENFQKNWALDYAKANNLWIKDLYSLGNITNTGGNENTLAHNENEGVIYKANNLQNVKFLISNLFKKIRLHNLVFPETRYDLVGFTGVDNGENKTPYIEVILKQDFVENAEQASELEIIKNMESLGFKNTFEDVYRKDGLVVYDLKPRNVLKDSDGDIYVVDAEFILDGELPYFK